MSMIMIVEDQPMNLKLVETILKANHFDYISADSGEAAIGMAQTRSVDLVLMDLQMPGMDGFETLAQMRRLVGYEAIPIIAISGNTTDADITRAEESGFNGFVKKPFKIDELIETISNYLAASE